MLPERVYSGPSPNWRGHDLADPAGRPPHDRADSQEVRVTPSFVAWRQRVGWSKGHIPIGSAPSHALVIWRATCGVEVPLRAEPYDGPDRCSRCIIEYGRLKGRRRHDVPTVR